MSKARSRPRPKAQEARHEPEPYPVEVLPISDLRPHRRNYRGHPEDELVHIRASLQAHGFYRNIIVARDGTILAGHGVVQAAKSLGLTHAPCRRLDLDPESPEAINVLIGDNEIGHLAEIDDRLLSELLKEVKEYDQAGLLGTGYDEKMLANLVFVTRPAGEIKDIDHAAHWVGMPEYDEVSDRKPHAQMTISFKSDEDRLEFARILGIKVTEKTKASWWPPIERDDLASVRFTEPG